MKTLDRYLLRETLPLFGGGLLVIVLLFLGGAVYEVLAPLVAKGADPYTLLRYLLFRTPEALARGAPVAYLFALLVLLSRLGRTRNSRPSWPSGCGGSASSFPSSSSGPPSPSPPSSSGRASSPKPSPRGRTS